MTTNNKKTSERRIRVRAVRRSSVDIRKLSRALIALALAQAEADAEASHTEKKHEEGPRRVA